MEDVQVYGANRNDLDRSQINAAVTGKINIGNLG